MRDRRICARATADAFAAFNKRKPLFIVRGHTGVAYYIFGVRIYSSGWCA